MTNNSADGESVVQFAPQESRFYIDVIRAYATVMIVLLHVAASYLHQSEMSVINWWIINVYHAWSRTAVPLFILISGALLLNPRRPESVGQFLRKRALRILPPFVIWSGIYLIYEGMRGKLTLGIVGAIASVLQKPAYGHLWFLYMIFGLYLMTPILRVYVAAASRENLLYGLALCFLFRGIFPFLQDGLGYYFHLGDFVSVSAYLGLFVGGYWLEQYPLTTKLKQRSILLHLGGVGLVAIVTALSRSLNGGQIQEFIYDMDSPLTLMMTAGGFLLLKSFPYDSFVRRWRWFQPLVKALSSTSFTIYLLHMMLVNSLHIRIFQTHLHPSGANPLWTIPLQTLSILVACYLFAVLVRKLPLGNWLAP